MFSYIRVIKDIFKKPRNSVSWQAIDYLKSFDEKKIIKITFIYFFINWLIKKYINIKIIY